MRASSSFLSSMKGSCANGSDAASRIVRLALAVLPCAALVLGCSPDVKDGIGPRVPIPNLTGNVIREGNAVAGAVVVLRDPTDNSELASSRTDAAGAFAFHAPVGVWEVKAEGNLPDDFDTITRVVPVPDEQQTTTLLPMDVFAYQARLLEPAAGASMGAPTPAQPLVFRWEMPSRSTSSARVQVYDGAGVPVWFSSRAPEDSATWNGLGNQSTYVGHLAPAGTYTWRVKFEFPDSTEARVWGRALVLQ